MLIYSGEKQQFDYDVDSGQISHKIEAQFRRNYLNINQREVVAWENSLHFMKCIIDTPEISGQTQIAIEYQIPQTSKRVDFLIAGTDDAGNENVVIVELKQWSEATKTNKPGIVRTYTGDAIRDVAHPSYQAYSYAKTIETYNATIQEDHISIKPCAYLHNYNENKLDEIYNSFYRSVINEAPLYIYNDRDDLREFITKYVKNKAKSDILYRIDNGKIRPSKALQDALESMLNGNEEFIMIDEQKCVYEEILQQVNNALSSGQKHTIIVEGGPGTGKSVVAIQLLTQLVVNLQKNAQYVTKNATPRNVYFKKLEQAQYKKSFVKTLFQPSSAYINAKSNTFDCLLVDEAHRLVAKSGLYGNSGENQIKEIINASKVSVFFIDEAQQVTTKDIGTVKEIVKWAQNLGSHIHKGEELVLKSQFRCNGSDGYIAFLDDLLGIQHTANYDGFEWDGYDFKIFDDLNEMREALRKKNAVNNKTRLLAGYCYNWISKKDPTLYDIEIGDFKAQWNFGNTSTWAIDEDSFDQVGCIHTSQGLEFDYTGVIIGKDLVYYNSRVTTNPAQRAKTDKSLWGIKSNPVIAEKADGIIRNTYKTLLSRAQKGCYVYCEDEALREYIKERLKLVTSMTHTNIINFSDLSSISEDTTEFPIRRAASPKDD